MIVEDTTTICCCSLQESSDAVASPADVTDRGDDVDVTDITDADDVIDRTDSCSGCASSCRPTPVLNSRGRYTDFLPRQSYIRTAGATRVVRRRKRNCNDSPRILLFVLCWLGICPTGAVENTLDMLRDEPGISGAQISQKIIQCNESRLCTSVSDNAASPLCGTDGRTYNSVCEIKKAICHGSPVQEAYKGPCSDKSKCALERAFQMELSKQKNRTAEFIPECELDGSYSTVQCHNTFGYCWCVNSNGRPIPGSSVQLKKPNCLPQGKVGRRSSPGKSRRVCSTADRSTLSSNLIKLFRSEFEQDPQNKRRSQDVSLTMSPTNKVIDWKFNNLDTDRNNKITRREIKTLRQLTVNLVRPKACAKRFSTYCDLDHDKKISRKEWSLCLGVDINIALQVLLALNSKNKPSPSSREPSAMMNDRATQHHSNISRMNGLHVGLLAASSSTGGDSGFMLKEKPANQPESHEEEKVDCKSQKQKALEEHIRTPTSGVYIPSCQIRDEKLFDSVQCHTVTGFCWCSETVSGRPIPGTSLKHMRPNCQNTTKNLNEFKGCNTIKRKQFFIRLYATLESSMIASGKGDYVDEVSRKEMAVRWQFSQLDKNKNEKLDRKEWRDYRNELKSWKGVRKCGRNFLRFCDQNTDKRITMPEWLECTIAVARKQTNGSRKGPNPFITILDPNQ